MQVANIPIQPATKPVQQQSEQPKLDSNDFKKALTDKLAEVEQTQTISPKTETEQKPKDETASEIIQVMVTPAMAPLMQVFNEASTEQAVGALTAVTNEVSPNISILTAQQIPTEQAQPVQIEQTQTIPQTQVEQAPTAPIEAQANTPQVEVKSQMQVVIDDVNFTEAEGNEIVGDVLPKTRPLTDDAVLTVSRQSETQIPEQAKTEPTVKLDVEVKANNQAQTDEAKVISNEVAKPTETEQPQAKITVETAQPQDAEVADDVKLTTDTPEPKVETSNEKPTEVKQADAKAGANNSDKGEQENAKQEVFSSAIELGAKKNLVKISDSSAKLDATPITSPQEQLVGSIKQNLVEGKTEFEMQLTPLNLGKITVKLTSENGALSVEFHAENPKTQALLNASANEIRELLGSSQSSTTQVITPNHSEAAQQNYTQQEQQQNKQQQQEQQNQHTQAEQSEKTETSTVDFLSILQQLKEQSRLTRI